MLPTPTKRTFRYQPVSALVWMGFGTAFFAVLFVVSAAATLAGHVQLGGFPALDGFPAAGFLGFTLVFAYGVWACSDRVEVDDVGIAIHRVGCRPRHLAWSNLRRVQEGLWQSALELHGRPDDPIVVVRFGFPEFEKLYDTVMTAAAAMPPARPPELPVSFRPSKVRRGVLLAVIVLIFLTGFTISFTEQFWVAILGFVVATALGSFSLVGFAREWTELTVEGDRLLLRNRLCVREIPYMQMYDFAVYPFRASMHVQLHLRIRMTNGESLELTEFQGQMLEIYEAIDAAWRCWLKGRR